VNVLVIETVASSFAAIYRGGRLIARNRGESEARRATAAAKAGWGGLNFVHEAGIEPFAPTGGVAAVLHGPAVRRVSYGPRPARSTITPTGRPEVPCLAAPQPLNAGMEIRDAVPKDAEEALAPSAALPRRAAEV
jgi:hypothetical protein